MEKLIILGDGSLLVGILILPFAVNGLILVIKGAFAYLEKLDEKRSFTKNWQVGLFGVATMLSYLGLFYTISKIL